MGDPNLWGQIVAGALTFGLAWIASRAAIAREAAEIKAAAVEAKRVALATLKVKAHECRARAKRTNDPDDIEAAILAERLLAEHERG